MSNWADGNLMRIICNESFCPVHPKQAYNSARAAQRGAVRAATSYVIANGVTLIPRASVAWQHAFSDVTPGAGLVFQNTGAAFTIVGVPIARDSALVEAGADLPISRQTTLGVAYVGHLAGNDESHSVNGKFNWKF
jgi:subtilase-type serine protease